MNKKALWILPLAASLALTGCSGLLGSGPSESPSAATSTPAAEAPVAETTAAAPTPEVESAMPGEAFPSDDVETQAPFNGNRTPAKQLTANQLYGVAQALKSNDPREGTQIMQDAELKAASQQIEGLLAGMNVSPAECGVFASAGLQEELSHVNLVSMVSPGDASAQGTTISIGSYEDASAVDSQLAKTRASAADCSAFTFTVEGQDASAKVQPGTATTDATTTLANLSTVDMAGKSVRTLSVVGYDGFNTVSVNMVAPTDPEVAVVQAQDLIDLALLHMSGQ